MPLLSPGMSVTSNPLPEKTRAKKTEEEKRRDMRNDDAPCD
jgi:hypothetical protein